MSAGETTISAIRAVDHLLLGVSDLDYGVAWIEKLTGVKAAVGGSHPGVGTRNALISLGSRRYLEIIAPDPMQKEYNFSIDIRGLSEPRLITWAAAAIDINTIARKAREAGFEISGPREGSRSRPDGKVLNWKSLGISNNFGQDRIEPIPFFIQWAQDSVHPSQDSPKGCELQSFEIEHPHPAELAGTLNTLGIEAKVSKAANARLIATLRTPKGEVNLS